MRREALWDRLYLSGIDSRAAELARENGLGLEIAAFCYAPNLEDRTVADAIRLARTEADPVEAAEPMEVTEPSGA